MALSGGSIRNFKRSIEKYIQDNLYAIENIDIDFEGVPFDDTAKTEWITPRILDISNKYIGYGSSTQYAEDTNVLYQFNIQVKKSNIIVSDRAYTIRDIIAKYFKINEQIILYNHIDDDIKLNSIKVRKIVNDFELSETNELIQYVFSLEIDYTKLTTFAVIKLLTEDFDFLITEDGDYLIKEDFQR